ncbi:MAG: hypothetical protein WC969_06420 [Elusimicrobiota bacterium]|jgi:hypothetical protein
MEDSEDSSITPGVIALLVLFILLTTGAALFVLMRSGSIGGTAAVRAEAPPPVASPFPPSEERDARLPDPSASAVQAGQAVKPLWETPENLSANAGGQRPAAYASSGGDPRTASSAPPQEYRPQPSVDADLVKAGLPADPAKAQDLASDKSAFGALFRSLAKHPKVLAALLNNEAVVKGFMSQEKVKRNCSSPGAMANWLQSPQTSGDVGSYVGFLQKNPGAASAMAGTKLVKSVMDCPGSQGLMHNPGAMSGIVTSNPAYMNLLTNPEVMKGLMSSPDTMTAFMGLKGGGRR